MQKKIGAKGSSIKNELEKLLCNIINNWTPSVMVQINDLFKNHL